ncbi:hypothetical protein C8Q79DRAFT_913615, partial [Trametes meyenii]
LSLPLRPKGFPPLYTLHNHVKAPNFGAYRGKIYLVLMDLSPKGLQAMHDFIKGASIPEGTEDGINRSGFAPIGPGDCLLARDTNGSLQEADDKVICWVTPKECFDPEDVAELWSVRDALLGPPDARTSSRAVFEDGMYTGGVAWERDPLALPVTNAPRCSTIALSFQAPRGLTSLTPGAKTDGGPLTPHQELRKRLIEVTARLGSTSMNLDAPDVAALLRERAEATNFPRIGSRDNCYFSTIQLNLSPAKGADAAPSQFNEDLGHFGGKHVDGHDALAALSHLIACSDLHGNEDPGIFVLLTFGVYIRLEGLVSCCFSGWYTHGGFSPTARPGAAPNPRSYRVVIVSYPQEAAFDAVGKYTLANLSDHAMVELPSEARDPKYDGCRSSVTPTSIAADGLAVTTTDALMNFIGRALVQLSHRVLQEVAPDLEVAFDATKFLGAISYFNPSTHTRCVLDDWAYAPHLPASADSSSPRQLAVQHWDAAFKRSIEFYPELMESGLREKHDLPVLAKVTAPRAGCNGTEKGESSLFLCRSRHVMQPRKRTYGGATQAGEEGHMRATKRTRLNPGTEADNSSLDAGGSSQTMGTSDSVSTGNDTSVPSTDMGDDGNDDDNGDEHEDNDIAMQDDPHGDPNFMPSGQPKPPGVHRRGQGPALLSPRQYAKVWAHSRDSNGGSDAGKVPLLGVHSIAHPLALSRSHAKFLLKLSLPYLENFLARVQQDVQDLGDNWATLTVAQQHASRTVHQVLHQSGRPVQFTSGYSAHLTLLWDSVTYLQQRNNFHHLQVQMVRSEYMLAITAAWTWLDVDIPSLAFGLLKHQVAETAHNKWLSKLLADIHLQLSKRALDRTPLRSSDYLSLSIIQTYTISPKVSVPRSAGEDVWNTTVVRLLCLALAAFLKYPNNQNRMQAAFVRHMLSAVGNADVLLIPGVFECFQRIRPNIFGSASARMSRLSLEHMAPFAEDLARQPLAKQGSPEHGTLAEITGNLETLRDLWRNFGGYGCNIPSELSCCITLPSDP